MRPHNLGKVPQEHRAGAPGGAVACRGSALLAGELGWGCAARLPSPCTRGLCFRNHLRFEQTEAEGAFAPVPCDSVLSPLRSQGTANHAGDFLLCQPQAPGRSSQGP